MLLAAFMAVTSVGWTHAQSTSGDGYEKTNDGYKVTTAAGFETVLGILNGESGTTPAKVTLAKGTYDLTTLAEVKKNLSVVGTDSTDCIINGKFDIKGSEQQTISFNNVKIDHKDVAITLTNPKVTLTLDAVAVYGSHCVKFDNYKATEAPTYNINNSALHARTYYALLTTSQGEYTWEINNSLLEGWCALYASYGKPNIKVTNSHLYGTTTSKGGTNPAYTNGYNGNGFATIVFESTKGGKLLLDKTDVKSYWSADANNIQNSVIFQTWKPDGYAGDMGTTGNVVELKNGSSFWIEKPDFTPIFVYHGASEDNAKIENNWVTTDGTATFKYGTDNLSAMVVSNNGNIRTAVAPVQGGIDNMNSWTADGDVVTFPNAGSIDLTKQWVIQNAITLKGNKTSIQATGVDWPKNGDKIVNSTANLISVEGSKDGTVTLEGLNILNSKAAGINAQSKMKTVLKDVTLKNNATAGLIVHSAVEATGLHTEGNTWGGVNVDKGTPDHPLSFTFDATSTFAESSKIWAEKDNVQPSAVTVPSADWTYFEGLGGGEGKTPMYYWTNSKLIQEGNTVFANGNPVTIKKADVEGEVIVCVTDDASDFIQLKSEGATVYGGAKNKTVQSSTITMESGTIKRIYGGGYGSTAQQTANVNGTATIQIKGGTITNLLCGGGDQFAKTNVVDINVSGNQTKVQCIYAGGFASPAQKTPVTVWNDAVCGTKDVKITISEGVELPEGLGCGGGQGYTYTGTSKVTITGAKLGSFYGTLSNGYADEIEATLKNCVFSKMGDYYEMGAINRGQIRTGSFTFDGCTFNNLENLKASLGAVDGWADSDTNGKPVPTVSEGVVFKFVNSKSENPVMIVGQGLANANIELTGAKASLKKFRDGTAVSEGTSDFAIASGKSWNFNSGLELGKGDDAATLTNNGTLNITASTPTMLQDALAVGANKIGLTKGEFVLTSQLKLSKPVSISGVITDKDTTTIVAAAAGAWTQCADKNDSTLLNIVSSDKVSLNNLNIKNSQRNGINIFESKGVTLNNVSVSNSKAAGLVINSSTVAATNFRTSGSGWGYGVNVDKGSNPTQGAPDPVFTIGSGCSFAEAVAIVSDKKDAPASYVVGNGWFKTTKGEASVWINGATSGLNFAITSVPSSVIYGQANLPLLTNVDSAYIKAGKVTISVPADNGVVSIIAKKDDAKYDSLQILKPGKVSLTLAVGDTTVVQPLEVLKKTLTITGITAKTKDYNGSKDVTLVTDNKKVSGLVGNHTAADVITVPTTGTVESANAGVQPVKVTATLKTDGSTNYSEYYELAEITGVTDTIKKVKLTYKTTTPEAINFGEVTTRTFTAALADGTAFVNNEGVSVLGGTLQFDCPATNTSLAGKYPVMPYGYTSNNYEISYKADSLQVKAVKPKAEITSVTVNGVGNQASITVSGRVLSNGGTPINQLTAKVIATISGENSSESETTAVLANDGTFKVENIGLTAKKYMVKLIVSAGGNLSSDFTFGDVNLAAKLQNVNFTSIPDRMTYGSTAGIAAASTEADAELVYSITGEAVKFNSDSTEVEAVKAGEATVTITATKSEHVTAVAKQTIKVEPKLVTVKAVANDKVYDGKLNAEVSFTAEGILEKDASVTLNATGVTGTFTDKNAGESAKTVILTGECELNNGNGNYVLAQPANPTAKISKAKITAISASDVQRSYKTTSLSYKLNVEGLVNGEQISTPGLYTGTIKVNEVSGRYTIVMDGVIFRNYDYTGVTPAGGDVNIIKGVPTVVTYNTEGTAGAAGMVVDNGGWENLGTPEIADATEGKAYAKLVYPEGIVTGNIIVAEQKAPQVTISLTEATSTALYSRKAPMTKAADSELSYSDEKVLNITVDGSYTVESTAPSVLTVYKKEENGSYYVKGTGVGTGAILIKVGEAVVSKTIKVNPAELTVDVSGQNKEYDGTTTANIALQLKAAEGASLDLEGVTFNYASKDAGSRNILPSKDIVLKGNNADNYQLKAMSLNGEISKRTLTVTGQVSKYYDGTNAIDLTDYSATGLLTEEAAPIITATFTDDANVGLDKDIKLALKGNNGNYVLAAEGNTSKGNISKSTLEATLPEKATDATNLKNNITYVVRETGETVKANAGINRYVTVTGSNPFSVKATDNENCVIIVNNAAVTKSDPVTPPSGSDDDATVTISLDATAKTLPRLEEFVLKATVSPAGQTVTWSSSDPTIASVTADGNKATVKALKVGTATITAKIGSVTATCEVTVDFATGLEEALANTQIYAKQGSIYVNPIQPLQLTIVNMLGKIVYNARISSYAQIPVTNGIYIVKLTNAGNTIVTKVNVY